MAHMVVMTSAYVLGPPVCRSGMAASGAKADISFPQCNGSS